VRSSEPGRAGRRIGWGWVISGIVLAIIIIPSLLSDMITDWMWFESQNLAAVYTTRLWLSVGVFFAAGLFAALFCWVNWVMALRTAPPDAPYPRELEPLSRGATGAIRGVVEGGIGLLLGLIGAW